MDQKNTALHAIQKKLVGKKLSYREIYAIMDEIAKNKLGDILTTYFVASGYSGGFTNEEMYYLTRAMVETGQTLSFPGIVADKHSIGGTPGTRTTMVIVPIIAAAGFTIPKSSSRAITTPAGTADCMEVLANVTFSKTQIQRIVKKTNGCIVWGGSFNIAPADDEIIKIEEPLVFESFDKVVVSVMAKKIAFGSTHVVIDLPYGKTVKVLKKEDCELIAKKFKFLAGKFKIKLETFIHRVDEPAGFGIGPLLETRDALRVLEQHKDRPMALEERVLSLCSILLDLCLEGKNPPDNFKTSREWAEHILTSGLAYEKMRDIIEAQGGNSFITSDDLHPAHHQGFIRAEKSGKIVFVHNKNLTTIAKILGAPLKKDVGIMLSKKIGDSVKTNEEIAIFYGDSAHSINEAKDTLKHFPIYEIS